MNSPDDSKDAILEARVKVREYEYQISKQLEQIDELQKEITEKQNQIKQTTLQATQIHNETTHICDENYRISADIDCKEKLTQSEKTRLTEKQEIQGRLKKKYNSLKHTNNDIKSKIEEINAYLRENTKNVNETSRRIESCRLKQKELQCENEHLSEKLSILQKLADEASIIKNHSENVDQKRNYISGQIMSTSEEIRNKEEIKHSLRKELSKLKAKELEYRSGIDKYTSSNKGRIFSKEDVKDVRDQLFTLKEKLSSLESANFALNAQISSMSHDNGTERLTSIRQQIETMKYMKPQSDVDSITQEMKDIQYKISKAEIESNELEESMQKIKKEKEELKTKLEESKQMYLNVQSQKAALLSKKQSIIESPNDKSIFALMSQTEELKKRVYLLEQTVNK